jgi:hypothetical protein
MLGKYAAAYVVIVGLIDGLITTLEETAVESGKRGSDADTDVSMIALALMGKEPKLPEHVADRVKILTQSVLDLSASRMTFPSVKAQANRILESVKNGDGPKAVAISVRELKTRLKDELNEREFLYVPPVMVKFYKDPMLFGKDVNDRFPMAIDDIEEAEKCLALGQGTACVLHTMRIIEVGLKALGNALNIPYAPSWESYLIQISANIAKKYKNKTAKWKRDEKFYRDLSGDLLIVKQAWRNPTMHVDRKYSVEEAEQIFTAAKSFMVRLAAHFSQIEVEKLLKKA